MKKKIFIAILTVIYAGLSFPADAQYNTMGNFYSGMLQSQLNMAPLTGLMTHKNPAIYSKYHLETVRPLQRQFTHSTQFGFFNSEEIKSRYIARVEINNPQAAVQLHRALDKIYIPDAFRRIVSPFGLKCNDIADVTTAYIILGLMIYNNAPPPSSVAIQNTRDQVLSVLVQNQSITDETKRREVGEELQLTFVMMDASLQDIRAGRWSPDVADEYRQAVAANFKQTMGIDLADLQIDDHGLHPRG